MKRFNDPIIVQSLLSLLLLKTFKCFMSTLKHTSIHCLHYGIYYSIFELIDYLTVFCAMGALIRIDLIEL